jgi:tetraacyldisaccharide 4'-kinase
MRKAWCVHLDEPSWWYREGPSTAANLLEPLGALYGWLARLRYQRSPAHRAALPVICVGNFTAGGTGKTPLTIYLCDQLKAAGHEPVALTRGYGGSLSGPYWVNAARDRARQVGDEALLLARVVPTLLARDRRLGAEAIEHGPHPATVIVMDDGLQNPSLAKDLSLAVVDGRRGLGNGRVMPAGPLRAPLAMQLELTDGVIVNEPAAAGQVTDWLRHRFPGPVLRARTVAAAAVDWLPGSKLVAWAGIGAPERFFSLLKGLGADLIEEVRFPDHHRLSQTEAERLLTTAHAASATLMTTEKDAVRLAGEAGPLAELDRQSRRLPITLEFSAADAERLRVLVDAALFPRAPGRLARITPR